ncbi:MAG: ABC transporter substrate-binding protein [Candidatus Staskawiczbacteria bacterium]|jgi:peptide/nickel transport system substrate-binding protein
MAKFPKFSQWKQFFKVLRGKERTSFLIFVVLAIISGGYLLTNLYLNNTKIAPGYGGVYTEGIVGQPRFINPIYGETNDVDRTLIDLIYSGLMTYDKDGKIINDLVKNYKISDNGKTYTFELKENMFWQDGVPLTVDDVIYTIETIQNSDYKSPLRANWLNVAVEKISTKSFALSLGSPYNSFLENCTLKIIPQHIWEKISPENFALSPYNLQPIGSGPYALSDIKENNSSFIKEITLSSNHKYYGRLPYISDINFKFFENKEDLISAANQKIIDGFSVSDLDDNQALAEKEIRQGWNTNEKFKVYSLDIPRYFAVFFNTQDSKILDDNNIAQGLIHSVNKQELAQKIEGEYKQKVSIVNSPILPEYFGYLQPTTIYNYDIDTANNLLDKSGYKNAGSGPRTQANTKKPAFQFKSYLSTKSSGNEVIELQGCLSRLDESFKNLIQADSNGKYGTGTEAAVTAFQQKYLPGVPTTGEVGTGTRKQLNTLCFVQQSSSLTLQFTLTTINQAQMVYTANLLKYYWEKVGVTVQIKAVELSELKDIIKNRNYEALLYGEALRNLPDLYPFWHSTQISDPGLNLSGYQDKNADQLLKDARETMDEDIKAQKYDTLQNTIISSAPALFLYNPNYLYWVSEKIKGIDTIKIVDPAKRFENISNWYIKTKRAWK